MTSEAGRWDRLFADLDAQSDALVARDRAAEVGELARAEISRLALVDRLGPALGTSIGVRSRGDVRVAGTVRQLGPDWVLLDEGQGREVVLSLDNVVSVTGVGRPSAAPPSGPTPQLRLGFARVLRGLARDRSPVRVHLVDASVVDGTIDRVGRDFVELAVHGAGEVRRRSEVRTVEILTQRAISAVRREG